MKIRVPPILQVLFCGVLSWGASHLMPSMTFDGSWRLGVAAASLAVGAVILVVSLAAFVRARTTVNPLAPEEAETLVTDGLYRFSRNPMYLSMAFVLTAEAFLIGNFVAFIGPLLFIRVMTETQIKPEERALQSKFDVAFEAYCRRTRRWI